jgi:hypothetical protein
MNIVVFVKADNAPGVSPATSSANRSILRTINSSSFRRTVDAATLLSATTIQADSLAIFPAAKQSDALFLRIKNNGKELDLSKSFTENKVTEGAMLEVHYLLR